MAYDYAWFQKSADYVRARIGFVPEVGLILGTGLGGLADEIEERVEIPYGEIPNFPTSTVNTHAGKLILGRLAGKYVVCMSGRFHYYEGYDFPTLTAPIRLFKLLGVEKTILTNAAGAVNTEFRPGDVMLIRDHLNFMGVSPTRGINIPEFGPRFFDVSDLYRKSLREVAKECAKGTSLTLREGVYCFFAGPQFETPAEIRAVRLLGADAVGMSTVPEALTAAHCGMPLLALSLMTNMAAGVLDQPLNGEEVEETAARVTVELRAYVKDIIAHI